MPKEVPLKLEKKKFLAVLLALVGAGVLSCVVLGSVTAYLVYFGDVSELKKSTILARINEETTLFTLDEETKIGSIFDDAHRSYVTIDQVPEHMIQAMVAAEDKNFFQHFGVDPFAIGLAFAEGVQNGFRFRRGGSSITQQTVKNIMDRREHSFKRKFNELIRSIQMERMYSKQQILEFYLNQFHVTANGKGIGIAARYYFDKDVKELNLVEAAFIAGSVKAPNKYNPFVKYTREDKEAAWNNANWRKNYVLRRMYEQGWIKEDEFKAAFNEKVPFNQGKFRTQEVALVSLIRGQLDKKEILEALDMESISELNHAGLKVYTTVDQKLQDAAQLQMRRNLSRLEMILEDYQVEDKKLYRALRDIEVNQFYYGKVEKVVKGKTPEIHVDFGLPKGIIPSEALIRTAKTLSIPTYRPFEEHLKEILDRIKVGDVVFVEVLEYNEETHQGVLELKKRPEVNGGLIAVDEGEVRAVVSGFDSQGFNRAVFATRQPGSVFKSVVFFAALQLGWTILDRIDNERRIFPFQGKFYLPRPDHSSPYEDVSIVWAGVKSENLATVYLTAHLLDKLNFEEFKELLNSMELMPIDGEAPRDFHYRVAKATGVQLDNNGVKEYMLNRAIEELKPDLIFSGRMELLREVSKIWWGRGYITELQNIYRLDDTDVSDRERNLRLDLVRKNWERLSTLALDARQDWNILEARVASYGPESIFTDPQTLALVSRFRVLSAGHRPALGYVKELPGEEFRPGPRGRHITIDPPVGRPLNPLDAQAIWGGGGVSLEDVNLGGFLPLRYYDRIAQSMENLYQSVISQKDQYSLYQYFNHHDFRIIVGLRYLVNLSRSMGVYSNLEPVLSFGLGTNDVSVAEVAKVYQTFSNGKTYRFYKDGPDNQLNFIRRIEDREGNLLYEPKRQDFQLVDPCYASQISEILRKVVTHGTGRRARGELHIEYPIEGQADRLRRIGVPAYGKTGTTNDYTTAYFAGYVPFPVKPNEALEPMVHSHVIASYVGYDHNRTMRRGGFRISGAYGALPVWTDYAKAMIKETGYQKLLDPTSPGMSGVQVWPTRTHTCAAPVAVDMPQGLVMQGGGDGDSYEFTNFEKEGETFQNEFARSASVRTYVNLATVLRGGSRVPRRAFQPFLKQDGDQGGPKLIEGQPSKNNAAARDGNIPVLPVMEPVPIAKGEAGRGTAGVAAPAGSPTQPAPAGVAPAVPSAPAGVRTDATMARPADKTSGAEKKVDPGKKIEEDAGLQDDELW